MAISPLIIVRFEKFKNWHQAEAKPVLWGGLGLRSDRPQAFKPAKGGRTGSILHTVLFSLLFLEVCTRAPTPLRTTGRTIGDTSSAGTKGDKLFYALDPCILKPH